MTLQIGDKVLIKRMDVIGEIVRLSATMSGYYVVLHPVSELCIVFSANDIQKVD
jgi:hypothetical protein